MISKKPKFKYPVLIVYSKGGGDVATLGLILVSVFILIYALYELLTENRYVGNWAVNITITSLVWMSAFIILTYKHYKSIYLFSTAYIVVLVLFHLSLTLKQGLGGDIPYNWGVLDYPKFNVWLGKAGWHVVLALCSFGIGVGLSAYSTKVRYIKKGEAEKIRQTVFAAARWSSIGLFAASAIFFVWAIASYGNILNYSRAEIFSSRADSRGFGAFTMVFPGAVMLYLLASENRKQMITGMCLCAFAFVLFMFSGYRAVALYPALVGTVIWVKSGRKLPVWLAVAGVVVVLFAISVAGILRTMGAYSELGEEELNKAIEGSSIEHSINTMGQTGALLAHVIRLVPKVDSYRYGSSYMYAFVDSIPNVGFKVDSSHSRDTLGQKALSDPEVISKMVPSDWMTYRIIPEQFKLGFGTGFTTIGEAYLNFSTPGVIVFFFILGYLIGKLDHKEIMYNPYLFLFCVTMLWPLMKTVRNDFSNFLKPAMFNLIILLLFWGIARLYLGKRLPKNY